jgi:hypothetical protein
MDGAGLVQHVLKAASLVGPEDPLVEVDGRVFADGAVPGSEGVEGFLREGAGDQQLDASEMPFADGGVKERVAEVEAVIQCEGETVEMACTARHMDSEQVKP